jgi:hypothetical protein
MRRNIHVVSIFKYTRDFQEKHTFSLRNIFWPDEAFSTIFSAQPRGRRDGPDDCGAEAALSD